MSQSSYNYSELMYAGVEETVAATLTVVPCTLGLQLKQRFLQTFYASDAWTVLDSPVIKLDM